MQVPVQTSTRCFISVSALCRLQEIQVVRVLRDNCLLEPPEDRVKGHCEKETTRGTTLSYSSGHKELSPFCSREFHVRSVVVINTSQEATEKTGQPSALKHREDPGVIDTGISSSKVNQKKHLILAEHTQHGPERWSQFQRCCLSFA